MNTNSNTYTVIYTAIVVIIVAAILAFVSQKLGPKQEANDKAETISQILTAAQFGEKEHWQELGNAKTIDFYKSELEKAVIINRAGQETGVMVGTRIYSVSELKAQNYNLRDGKDFEIPVYVFNNGIKVLPIYGAGLWGPVWGYIAVKEDNCTIAGVYFDHASETPGLGGKIKDDPSFRASFKDKKLNLADPENPFGIIKGGVKIDNVDNTVDAITGATMTSKGLNTAICTWIGAFNAYLTIGGQSNE